MLMEQIYRTAHPIRRQTLTGFAPTWVTADTGGP